jgi:hypothetical protein
MIIVRLMGGLGNQMFQYAFGRQLSILRKTSLKLDISLLEDKTANHTQRQFELGIFNLGDIIAPKEEVDKFLSINTNKLKRIVHSKFPILLPYYSIRENGHGFDPKMLLSPENTLLTGYWQSEKYFSEISGMIKKDFSLPEIVNEKAKLLASKISSCNSVGVHIRRGDYISNPETNKFHGTCGIEYYSAAIQHLSSTVTNPEFFIFSDDINWLEQNMFSDKKYTYVTDDNSNAPLDMHLMSLCNHNIIANSSFSWWAAWLNTNPNKMVIGPKNWVNDTSVNTSDVIPENWIKL